MSKLLVATAAGNGRVVAVFVVPLYAVINRVTPRKDAVGTRVAFVVNPK